MTTVAELKQTLIASWPPGASERLDWDDAPGKHVEAVAETIKDNAVDVVEDLAAAVTPLTAPAWRIKDWERAFGLSATKTALFGTLSSRRNAVVSRWREYGPPTVSMIQGVVAPLLDYSQASDLVILQPDRDDLRAKHTYGPGPLGDGSFDASTARDVLFSVRDDAALSPSGAQVDLTLSISDLQQVQLTLYAPSGASATIAAGSLGRGAASSKTLRCYFCNLRGTRPIFGQWRLHIESLSGSGTIEDAQLFAEGFGRDVTRNNGLSYAAFGWAAVFEPLKSGGDADIAAARAAIARISYASRPGALVFIADAGVGLSTGDYGCIPNDNSTPGAFVPGGP